MTLQIVVITSAVTVCFGLRCAMLLYRPVRACPVVSVCPVSQLRTMLTSLVLFCLLPCQITNKYLQLDLFYWLAYFIPETIPICLQLAAYVSPRGVAVESQSPSVRVVLVLLLALCRRGSPSACMCVRG